MACFKDREHPIRREMEKTIKTNGRPNIQDIKSATNRMGNASPARIPSIPCESRFRFIPPITSMNNVFLRGSLVCPHKCAPWRMAGWSVLVVVLINLLGAVTARKTLIMYWSSSCALLGAAHLILGYGRSATGGVK